MIGIWNRSHYEDVLIARVHHLVKKKVWKARYEQINAFEKILTDNGTTILKFMLHISKEEQMRRLQARIENPKKQWKFNPADLRERSLWDDYQAAYEDAIKCCSTKYAPWHIVRSDEKRRGRLNCISHLLRSIPYKRVPHTKVKLPKRSGKGRYDNQSTLKGRNFVRETY